MLAIDIYQLLVSFGILTIIITISLLAAMSDSIVKNEIEEKDKESD